MSLTEDTLRAIKTEVENDPERRGYNGKTEAEIAGLLNETYDETIEVQQPKTARINQVLSGIAFTPNRITSADVNEALRLT